MNDWIEVGTFEDIRQEGSRVVKGIMVFYHEDTLFAVDNRCPHMGFPLNQGTVCDGILTCHWHHARFDVDSGGTLDPWADDVPSHEVVLEEDVVWVNPRPKAKRDVGAAMRRLREGLEQNISLIIAKSVISLLDAGVSEAEIAQVGIEFGTSQRAAGCRSGLTILTAMVNVLPKLDYYGRVLALFQGLVHVAKDCAGVPPRYMLTALPETEFSHDRLEKWYRQSVEVRDTEGAERILRALIANNAGNKTLLETMAKAATDHFYLDGGHTLDFHNKAFEILPKVEGRLHAQVLTSLVPLLGDPTRSEELQNWNAPDDLVTPLRQTFAKLPEIVRHRERTNDGGTARIDEAKLVEQLLNGEPRDTVHELTSALEVGLEPAKLAQITALAAAERIAQFHTQNDFSDWIAVLHTFTHAHAVHQLLLQSDDPLLIRAVYYAAMRIYLDRFLNIPSAHKPDIRQAEQAGYSTNLEELLTLTNQQQQVTEAANWVAHYVHHHGDIPALVNTLGQMLLREDAEFHSFQMFEAATAEYDAWAHSHSPFQNHAQQTLLTAVTRYLAAHAPTSRELPQVARIAWRLHRGERLFEAD